MVTKTNSTNRIAETADVMRPEIVTFKIVGISPLLQNNPANFIGVAESAALATKKQYDDKEEARLRVYLDEEGIYYHPSQAFIKAMVKAVAGRKFGKIFATKAISGSVFIVEPHCTILGADGKPAKEYTIDRQPVVVGKARVLRCRPCWPKWSMNVALDIDTAIISREQVGESLSLAGRTIGIGDYRPEKSGGYGRFRVE